MARKALILFSVVFLLDALYIAILAGMLEQTTAHLEEENRAKLASQKVASLSAAVQMVFSDMMAHRISKRNTFDLEESALSEMVEEESYKELPKVTAELMKIAGDDPLVRTELEEVKNTCTKGIPKMMHDVLTLKQMADGPRIFIGMEYEFDQLDKALHTLENHYKQVQEDADAQLTEQSGLLLSVGLITGGLLNAAIALLLYSSFISNVTRRLHRISDDITEIAVGKSLPEGTFGGDEIDQLALQLRSMSESLEKFRTKEQALFNNTASVICSVNHNGVLEMVGPGSTSLWGYTPAELIGRRFESLISDGTRHDQESDGDHFEQIKTLFQDKLDRTFESKLVRKDGRTIDVLWKARLSADHSTAVLVAHDVTERNAALQLVKQQQEEFSSIVERMPIAVVTTDDSFGITSVNSATGEMFKRKPTDILARSLNVLMTGESASDENSNLAELMRMAEKQPVELTIWRSETDKLPVELNSRSYTDTRSRNVFLATFRDISVRTEIEQVKNEFVAMISHDLRSPLTALVGTLETMLALREREPARQQEFERDRTGSGEQALEDPLDRARSIAANLVNLVNDFLDLEKFEAGMGVLDSQTMPIEKFIDEIIKPSNNGQVAVSSEFVIPSKSVALSESAALTRSVTVDSDRMTFAFSNFLLVVTRFSNPGSQAELSVTVEKSAVIIKITGDGFKLPSEIKEAWHSQYTFVPALATDSAKSSGLGLALSRAIVHAHAGSVSFDSQDGKEFLRIELMLAI